MSTSRHIDKICIAAISFTLILTILFMCGGSLGIAAAARTVKYESTLFDTSYVHRIDIVMDDWDSFIETCESEEYSACTVVIDGEKHTNIGIRGKGNTSLSNVSSAGSQRYSFKLEFDHYEDGKSMDGLDKLCLNNLIQDNTMMKDYLAYMMMDDFGVSGPLCSFVYLTVNGEDWGLYLAVEGVEDSFLSRTYGSDGGDLYKPDSLSFGGGRGNGKDFDMGNFDFSQASGQDSTEDQTENNGMPQGGIMPDFGGQNGEKSDFSGQMPDMSGFSNGEMSDFLGDADFDPTQGGGFGGGMGSDDVKLKYIDDDPDSYSNIFDNAKTDVSAKDQERLIESLKSLSAYSDLKDVLNTDEVLRYFVVHNFICNGDSYTGSMIHNYYLHESSGTLEMIPWDYNLGYGTFQGGDASGTVNTSIDSPVSGGSVDDRPMVGWIFSDEEYTGEYHQLFAEFIERWFADGELEKLISDTAEMLSPYVEKDPTKFCTLEEFEKGVTALKEFVSLRGEAVKRQLAGDQTAVDTGSLNLSDMGTMGGGMGSGQTPDSVPGKQDGAGSQETETQTSGKLNMQDDGLEVILLSQQTTGGNQMPSTGGGQFPGNMPQGNVPDFGNGEMPSSPPGGFSAGDGTQSGENDSAIQTEADTSTEQGSVKKDGDTTSDPVTGQKKGNTSFMPGNISDMQTRTSNEQEIILLAVSVVVLAVGLLIAARKKY